jgi:hypothetical protein
MLEEASWLVILLTDMFSGHYNVVIFDLTFCSFIIVADMTGIVMHIQQLK